MGNDWNVGIISSLLILFRRFEPHDIIIDEVNVFPAWTPLVTRTPKVLLLHHLAADVLENYEFGPLTRSILRVLQALFLRAYRGLQVITPSPDTYAELTRHGYDAASVALCLPGVPDLSEYLRLEVEKVDVPRAIYVGRVVPQKGIESIIHAFQEVVRDLGNAELVVCGRAEDRYRTELESLVGRLGLDGYVRLTGFVPERKKRRLLGESHLYVIHSAKEGWGIAAMEALALGTPVVASDVPGLRQLVKHGKTGFLVPHGDIEELGRVLTSLLREAIERTEAYKRMVSVSRTDVSLRRFDETARCFQRVLDSACQLACRDGGL